MNQKVKWICNVLRSGLLVILFLYSATAFGYLFRGMGFPQTNIVIIYILFILLVARLTEGYVYGILASVAATLMFNYFFAPPYFTLSVDDPSYFITFVIMTMTAIITSATTSRVKQNAKAAEERESETRALYQLTNRLTSALDITEIAELTAESIGNVFSCKVLCLSFEENESSDGKADTEYCDWPINAGKDTLGVIRIPKDRAEVMTEAQKNLLLTMIESTTLAMDRFRQVKQRMKSNEEMVQERYRGNLLRAISHDLRTPLTGIMGTSEMLMDMTEKTDARYEMAKGIYKDADWLRSLVINILNLTRLQENKLIPNKTYEAVEEIVGSAVNHISRRSPEYEISVKVPEELLLIPMDAKLIEQVLINLLDNAIKHTNPQNDIWVIVEEHKEAKEAEFMVMDNGEGIREADLLHIFQMFYTSNGRSADVKQGIGLGLTICEAIIKAHGGTIKAENRTDTKGAKFSFTLPVKEESNEQQ